MLYHPCLVSLQSALFVHWYLARCWLSLWLGCWPIFAANAQAVFQGRVFCRSVDWHGRRFRRASLWADWQVDWAVFHLAAHIWLRPCLSPLRYGECLPRYLAHWRFWISRYHPCVVHADHHIARWRKACRLYLPYPSTIREPCHHIFHQTVPSRLCLALASCWAFLQWQVGWQGFVG